MTDHVVLLLNKMRPSPGRLCKANGTVTSDWSLLYRSGSGMSSIINIKRNLVEY